MPDIWDIVLRTVITYFVVFIVMRIMGKREIGKLSIFDLVISVMIAEIAVIVISEPTKHMLHAIAPMLTLLAIQVITSIIILKFRGLRLLFDGKPTIVIAKGKLNREAMRKSRYNLDDLMVQLREQSIASVADVEFAILEPSGKLSVIQKEQPARASAGAARASDESTDKGENTVPFPPKYRFEMLPIPLIMDGKVQDENLEKIGKNRFWLKNELRAKKISDFKDVFLCTIDHRGRLFVDSDRKPKPGPKT